MITRTGFPEYLETITIGDSPQFLRENVPNLCYLVDEFPEEINLAYLWKKTDTDPDTIGALRTFTKHFLLDAPKLSTEHIIYYRDKIRNLPPLYRDRILNETGSGFSKVENLSGKDYSLSARDFGDSNIDNDRDFLSRLAALMQECESSCNYFKNLSNRVGSIYDFSLANSIHNSPPQDKNLDSPPPSPLSLEKYNKIPTAVLEAHATAYTSMKAFLDKSRERLHNFVSTHSLESLAKKGETSDKSGAVYLGATSPSVFQSTMAAYSNGVSNNRTFLGDCYRITDYMARYNPFNPEMNVAVPINKNLSIRTLTVSGGTYVDDYTIVKPNLQRPDAHKSTPYDLSPNAIGIKKINDEKPVVSNLCISRIEQNSNGAKIKNSSGTVMVNSSLLLMLCQMLDIPEFSTLKITSAYREGDRGAHGLGEAVDFGFNTNPKLKTDSEYAKRFVTFWMRQGAAGLGWEGDHIHIDFGTFRNTFTPFGPDKTKNSLNQTPDWFQGLVSNRTPAGLVSTQTSS